MTDLLKKIFNDLGIQVNNEVFPVFQRYSEILVEWNEKFNLTGITEENDIAIKHFADSMLIFNDIKSTHSLIDIGSGAGFPGIPLKIAGYEGKIVLLEANNKKKTFLEYVINELHLQNIYAMQGRAETFGRNKSFRENFDVATARAVAPLNILLELCVPFIKRNGVFIAMKTDSEEIKTSENAITQLKLKVEKVENVSIPYSDITRCNMYFTKLDHTPDRYPRADGVPKKKPL